VSHLFFNTPARRKFLKSEATESRQIIRVTERMALGKPSAAVSLELNEREVFQLQQDQPTSERMAVLFGVDHKSIVEYDVELSGISYLVYLAHPDQARHDRTRICLFINGRSVTSSAIIHAVTAGYGEFLPSGKFPLAAVFITVDPQRLDVNVHPTKAEVRLSEERAIHDNLYRIVKKALRDWRLVPSSGQAPNYRPGAVRSDFRTSSAPAYVAPRFGGGSTPLFDNRPSQKPQGENIQGFPASAEIYAVPACDNTRPVEERAQEKDVSLETVSEDDVLYLGKAGRLYLLLSIGGELYIVDQHAAHERVLYEEALHQVERGSTASQKILFPESVELSAEEFLTYESSQTVLSKLGFDTGPFGSNAIIINGMPPVFRDKNPASILRKLLDDIGELNKAGGELIKSVAQSMACRAAVMAGDRLSSEEVKALASKLFSTNNPYCCPHGRPTFIKISLEELDGRFGRV
jgi:DNA mismatch repair protein MutL